MNRAGIRKLAQSMVDSVIDEDNWDTWIDTGISNIESSLPSGFMVTAITAVVNGAAALPSSIIIPKKVEYQETDGSWVEYTLGFSVVDKALKFSDATIDGKMVRIIGDGNFDPLEDDDSEPASIPTGFHDVPALYAAYRSQLWDDEFEKAQALLSEYNTRLSMCVRQMAKSNTAGRQLRLRAGRWN